MDPTSWELGGSSAKVIMALILARSSNNLSHAIIVEIKSSCIVFPLNLAITVRTASKLCARTLKNPVRMA